MIIPQRKFKESLEREPEGWVPDNPFLKSVLEFFKLREEERKALMPEPWSWWD